MGLFIPGGRPRPRQFHYEPRYYDPKKEEGLKRRMRIQAKGSSARRRRSPTAMRLVFMLVLLAFALYIYNAVG